MRLTVARTLEELKTAEVAHALACSEQFVRQLADRGELAHTRTPYGRVFDPHDVERLAQQRAARAARLAATK